MSEYSSKGNELMFSIRDSISESRIEMIISISEKLKILIANNGIEYLKQKAFINALADYQIFNHAVAYKNTLIFMLENGLIDRLIEIDYSLYKLEIDRFCDEYAMQPEVVCSLAEAIAVALSKTSSFVQNQNTSYIDFCVESNEESNFFIPTKEGNFIPATNIPDNVSFNEAAKILGHDSNQYYTYVPGIGADIYIMFESFTGHILYVYVNEKTNKLDSSRVKQALREYSFTEKYDYSQYYNDIDEGIRRGNLSKEFFKKVLNQDSDIMIDGRFNTRLIFENDRLVKMESLDYLSTDAKSLRDTTPSQFNRIKKYAESFNFSQELVSREINMQVDAFFKMPFALFDNFSEFYVEVNDEIWSTNYVMCAVAYAKKQINFDDFKLISHDEYSNVGEFTTNGGVNVTACSYLGYVCLFDRDNGNFICCYKNGEDISSTSNINMTYLDKF